MVGYSRYQLLRLARLPVSPRPQAAVVSDLHLKLYVQKPILYVQKPILYVQKALLYPKNLILDEKKLLHDEKKLLHGENRLLHDANPADPRIPGSKCRCDGHVAAILDDTAVSRSRDARLQQP